MAVYDLKAIHEPSLSTSTETQTRADLSSAASEHLWFCSRDEPACIEEKANSNERRTRTRNASRDTCKGRTGHKNGEKDICRRHYPGCWAEASADMEVGVGVKGSVWGADVAWPLLWGSASFED